MRFFMSIPRNAIAMRVALVNGGVAELWCEFKEEFSSGVALLTNPEITISTTERPILREKIKAYLKKADEYLEEIRASIREDLSIY